MYVTKESTYNWDKSLKKEDRGALFVLKKTAATKGDGGKNYEGVNHWPLVDIDPCDVLIPTLHCPMGQVNKLLKHLVEYLLLYSEHLGTTSQKIHEQYIDLHKKEKELEEKKMKLTITNPMNELKVVQAELSKMASARVKAKKEYDKMQKARKCIPGSLATDIDAILKQVRAVHEHYHGGDLDGNSC